MAEVQLKGIGKVYDKNVRAVEDVNIDIKDKEFVVLVGPSGCGKTTTLRMIAGLEDITEGDILIDGKRVNDEAPKDRDIAMVFQNYALYPHMSVYDNMAFGLKIRKFAKDEIERRVQDAAKILDIVQLLSRKPKQLSGGQRQRVAVGRAIVRNPKVFLFDEPLSNLDAKLRVQMRTEISSLHSRLEATIVYVTHDQVEAMTMGDKIVVMQGGKIQQIGSPLKLYNDPINRFVAGFIGSPPMNINVVEVEQKDSDLFLKSEGTSLKVPAKYTSKLESYVGKKIYLGIRPEDLSIIEKKDPNNTLEADVQVVEPLGAETHLYLGVSNHQFIARVAPTNELKIGQKVLLAFDTDKITVFDLETEKSLFFEE